MSLKYAVKSSGYISIIDYRNSVRRSVGTSLPATKRLTTPVLRHVYTSWMSTPVLDPFIANLGFPNATPGLSNWLSLDIIKVSSA